MPPYSGHRRSLTAKSRSNMARLRLQAPLQGPPQWCCSWSYSFRAQAFLLFKHIDRQIPKVIASDCDKLHHLAKDHVITALPLHVLTHRPRYFFVQQHITPQIRNASGFSIKPQDLANFQVEFPYPEDQEETLKLLRKQTDEVCTVVHGNMRRNRLYYTAECLQDKGQRLC